MPSFYLESSLSFFLFFFSTEPKSGIREQELEYFGKKIEKKKSERAREREKK